MLLLSASWLLIGKPYVSLLMQVFIGAAGTIFDDHFMLLWEHEAEKMAVCNMCNEPTADMIPLQHYMVVAPRTQLTIESSIKELMCDITVEEKWCPTVKAMPLPKRQLVGLYMEKYIRFEQYKSRGAAFVAKLNELAGK